MGEMMSKTVKLENGHTITFDEDKHVYIHNNEYVVGMSTLLGKLASPALEAWKVNTQVNAIKKEMEKQNNLEINFTVNPKLHREKYYIES